MMLFSLEPMLLKTGPYQNLKNLQSLILKQEKHGVLLRMERNIYVHENLGVAWFDEFWIHIWEFAVVLELL